MKEKMITQSTVLSRGWSKGMIEDLLPPPVEKRNPYYRCAAPMRLYPLRVVEKVETTEEFEEAAAIHAARSAAAKKGVATKMKNAITFAENIADHITVEVRPLQAVRREALEHKQDLYDWIGSDSDAFSCMDEGVIRRWTFNYIRHELTRYDDALNLIAKKPGIDNTYHIIRSAVMQKIAEAYPELSESATV